MTRTAHGDPVNSEQQVLARTFHRALTTKDWLLLRSVMSPDVTWVLPGDNVISGAAEGIDAVIARAELIASYGVTFTLQHVLVSRDHVALALHNTARRSDAVLDEHLATVCRIADDRIVGVETFLSDVAGMNAFFIPIEN